MRQTSTVAILVATFVVLLSQGCYQDETNAQNKRPEKKGQGKQAVANDLGKKAMTDDERLAQLLKYFRKNRFPLEKKDGQNISEDCRYVIERSANGAVAHTGFVFFRLNSDDAKNKFELNNRNAASIYNPHCKIAMWWPGVAGSPDAPRAGTAPDSLSRHMKKGSTFIKLFQKFETK